MSGCRAILAHRRRTVPSAAGPPGTEEGRARQGHPTGRVRRRPDVAPLLVLSLAQGVAFGHRVELPFLADFSPNVRFLVALPILVLAESRINRRWRQLVLEFLRSRLVAVAERPAFESAIERINTLRDRVLLRTHAGCGGIAAIRVRDADGDPSRSPTGMPWARPFRRRLWQAGGSTW